MGIKLYNPTSPGRRNASADDFKDITYSSPEKSLTRGIRKKGGRNNTGKMTVRHRGGGHKRRYRTVDFKRDIKGTAIVLSIEYDPNRSSRIALVRYENGRKSYILAPVNLAPGDTVQSSPDAPVRSGNTRPLSSMPLGTTIHNIEMTPGAGGQLVKSAGTEAQIMAHEGNYTLIRLPSGEMRQINSACKATIGTVSNPHKKNIKLGKAGRSRHLGRRPSVRGTAMAPNAHPHGGGEGKSPIGLKGPKTPWGKPARGYRTRRNKLTDKYILRRRKA